MFEEGWLSLILEEGPLTRDIDVPFCSDEGLNSCSACWVSSTDVDGSELDGTDTASFSTINYSSLCLQT